MKHIVYLVTGLFLCCLPGLAGCCSFIRHLDQAILLKRFADNQRQIQEYIDRRDSLFRSLKSDVENSRLEAGVPEERMVSEYGPPVICWDRAEKEEAGQTCLYRRATHYFNTDTVYLEFDKQRKLRSWKLIPASSVR